MEMLRLYTLHDLEGCPTDKWGILDPGTARYDSPGETRENGGCASVSADDSDGLWLRSP